jgi:PAS domain S-box-containing protein
MLGDQGPVSGPARRQFAPSALLSGEAWAQTALLAALVVATAWLSFAAGVPWGRVTPIWIPNPVWLVFLLSAPKRRWPLLLVAGWVANVVADVAFVEAVTWGQASWLSFCNALQVAAAAWAVGKLPGGRLAADEPRSLVGFALIATVVSLVGCLLGGGGLALLKGVPMPEAWPLRALANGLGLLLFAPPLIVLAEGGLKALTRPGTVKRDSLVFGVLGGVILLSAVSPPHPILLLAPPALVFAALQLEFAAAALALLAVTASALIFVTVGWTPDMLKTLPVEARLMTMQVYLMIVAAMVFPVASTLKRRRELESELIRSHAKLEEAGRLDRLALGLAGLGYWRTEAGSGRFEWSRELFDIYGLDPADGAPDMERMMAFVHPEDQPRLLEHHARYSETEASELAIRIVRPDGEVRHVISHSMAERDEKGQIVARFGAISDVTDIKQAEAAARESRERYRFLADNVPDMITRCSLRGEVIYISPGSKRVFGRTPEEMLALNAKDMVHPEDMDRVVAGIGRLIGERLPHLPEPLVYRAMRKDGTYIWIEANPTLIVDGEGQPMEFIDVVRDVTAAKRSEAELKEARVRAEAAAAAKSAFLANMSHELRTPLTSIIGFSQLMGERGDLPEEARRYASRIGDASHALLAIINDVLDFSKLEAGQVTLETQPLSIRRLLDETTGIIAIQAAAKGLKLEIDIDEEAPELIEGDVARLRQVLLNFLSNAVKFTAKGQVTTTATWRETKKGPRLKISVADTGAGISRESVAKLFERFSQAEVSINRTHGGTGLGLAISKGIIELMGGRIGVDTKAGKGSTFWFEVPAEAATAEEVGVVEAEEGFEIPPLRILMVDDTAVNRELVRLMLTPLGFIVEEASGGAEGVKAAMTRPFDLILMDVRMPGVDGHEATRVIRATSEINRGIPILALTADVHPENAAACRSAGMDDVLAKPIVAQELIGKILHWGLAGAVEEDQAVANG